MRGVRILKMFELDEEVRSEWSGSQCSGNAISMPSTYLSIGY